MKVKELIERLSKDYNPEDHTASHIWSTADVIGLAKQMKVESTSEAEDIIDDIDEHIDSEYGVSWMTIRCGIEDHLERSKRK